MATQAQKTDDKSDQSYLTGLTEYLRRYTPNVNEANFDLVAGRYRINLGAPLPDYNTKNALAYAVEDTKDNTAVLFGLVCPRGSIQRNRLIEPLKNFRHPNLISLVAAGAVEFSTTREERFVLVYEHPAGRKLSVLLSDLKQPLSELFIRERIIAPLSAILQVLGDMNIAHGSLNIDNIYFKDVPVLGDFISEPCGFSQPFYYEPLERMQTLPNAKGDGNGSQDYYALAVVVLYILLGPRHFAPFTPDNLPSMILREGAQMALTRNRDYPEVFYEFFRGLLGQSNGDNSWNSRFLKPWIEGKRFNMLSAPPPTETNRPFDLGSTQISSRRELAHVLHTQWDLVSGVLENGQLPHWVALCLRNKELAESLSRVGRMVGTPAAKQADSPLYELLLRVLLQLDAIGPIRFKQLSFNIDGIGSLCTGLFADNAQPELQLLTKFIGFSMVDVWMEAQRNLEEQRSRGRDYTPTPAVTLMMTQMDRLRQCIRNMGLGFGAERMLYDLNPDLPCLSPMLTRWHVTTIPALLKRLDEIAPTLSANEDPIDKHIAAFICSKLVIQHELRLRNLETIPALANHRGLIALSLLARAHARAGNLQVPGLTHWLALRIMPILDGISSRSLRNHLKKFLTEEANTGRMQQLSEILIENDFFSPDKVGFHKAQKMYEYNTSRIAYYSNKRTAERASELMGVRVAKFIAYIGLLISIFLMFGGQHG